MRLAIFDVDGTLVDSQAQIWQAMQAAFGEAGVECPARAQVLGIVGLSLPAAMAVLAPDASPESRARLCDSYKDGWLVAARQGPPPLYPGVTEMLDQLAGRDGVLLGIATGKSRRGLDVLFEVYRWHELFATQQVSDDHPSKPHPSMLHAAMRETGVVPQAAAMIGDTEFDIAMARSAGIAGVGVSWGYHSIDLMGADHVIEDFGALPAVLDQIWSPE